MNELARFRAAERWLIKKLRRAVDRADEVLHAWEIHMRQDAADGKGKPVSQIAAADAGEDTLHQPDRGVTLERDVDRHLFSPSRQRLPKKRRRMTAAEFDLDIRMRSAARAGAR